jgi:hypothetical protein
LISYNEVTFSDAVFHGFGGRMSVSDVGMTPLNKIMEKCFTEVGLKQRDYNGKSQFGSFLFTEYFNIQVFFGTF